MSSFDYVLAKKHFNFVNPVTCGYEYCLPGSTPGQRKFDFYTLHFVVSGTGIFQVNGKEYQPKKHDCFVMRPNELYYYKADKKNPWHYVWIGFITDIPLPKILDEDIFNEPRLLKPFRALEKNFNIKDDVEEYVYGKMFEILAILRDNKTDDIANNSSNLIAKKTKSFIESNYMNNLTVQQLANLMNLERTYFSVAFKKAEGMSPQKYLNRHRLLQASKLLTNSNYNINQIADLCGFTDAFSFSRAFKNFFGVSPKEYRQEHQNKVRTIP